MTELRHSRAGGDPDAVAGRSLKALDSRLRGNDDPQTAAIPPAVIPAEAGIQGCRFSPMHFRDSRLRGNDGLLT